MAVTNLSPRNPSQSGRTNLGDILVEVGVISQEQLNQAVSAGGGSERDLGKWLIDLGFTTEEKIMKGIGIKAKVPYFTSLEGLFTPESANIISEELARRLQVVPLFKIDNVATVAMVNPLDVFVIDSLVKTTGFRIDPVVCMRSTIFETIGKLYGGWESNQIPISGGPAQAQLPAPSGVSTMPMVIEYPPTQTVGAKPSISPSSLPPISVKPASDGRPKDDVPLNKLLEDLKNKMPEQRMSQMDIIQRDIQKTSEDMPIVQLVDAVFRQAVTKKASDIHIEPFVDHTEVRFRIDGVLRPIMTVPKEFENALVSRIKVMANLDITENRQPQDGRVMTEVGDRHVDLRISTLPIIHGEKTVIRILDKGSTVFELPKLGFSPEAETLFKECLDKPNGIILVTGPTGSGKSTTLYTGLTILNSPERNIVTLEDPVEYQLARINQVQVNQKVGLTFAKGLRSILRQDPDVIMVGEIRDLETAEISIQAALTGHLVLSTLHTNDAPSAITRLRYMRVEPFLISASVLLIIAQRLVRVLCPECKEADHPPKAVMDRLEKGLAGQPADGQVYKPHGCDKCNQTGYKGRKGLYEIFKMSTQMRELTVDPKSGLEEIRSLARSQGMRSLYEEGTVAVMRGQTSIEEMMRVCTIDE
ncbi:MAG TPA: ATPase, T2SS/T4P/T4SS family [Elusimicrobiota bacterium]|nr:ATPase, T2SS/T4P/T4SS family [Elusimicrobiota bacterium]